MPRKNSAGSLLKVAGVFLPDLKRLMKEHGFNNQQDVYQNLLRNVIAADFESAAQMLKCHDTFSN
ncbi:hypothetical protein [Pseudomonas fluorescens]|uniref:Uncharacterized protein n=1 Tax=Pseudomonas fluorescens TaxID=294 RepID=A0A5E7AGC3_PSEFL|nr:hypothetical protein [Pseudomonas fluorescens]VVN75654.1 hypothetical protein PS833_00715 [Pseudomonas fluorescens]